MNDDHFHGFNESRKANQPLAVLHPKQDVGRFSLLEMLGHGGMGQVWKAIDPNRKDDQNSGFVVLKFLPDVLRFNADATEEFKGAYRRVQALHHEHICPLYDIGEEPGLGCFQVMQFLEGITLRTLVRQEDPQKKGLAIRRVLKLLAPIAEALDYAHRNNLIHRDIKPENIIFDPATGGVHLIDFGLAAQVRTSMSKYSQQQMSTSGTGAYMSPEQWQGQLQEAASDQWALAVVAWELLTGSLPFHGDGMQLGFAVLQADLSLLPEAIRHLQPVFLTGMAKDRKQRYPLCVELLKSLAEAKPAAPTIETTTMTVSAQLKVLKGRDGADIITCGTAKAPAVTKGGECWCGCGGSTKSRFAPGHDAKLHSLAKKAARGEEDLNDAVAGLPHDAAVKEFEVWYEKELAAIAMAKAKAPVKTARVARIVEEVMVEEVSEDELDDEELEDLISEVS